MHRGRLVRLVLRRRGPWVETGNRYRQSRGDGEGADGVPSWMFLFVPHVISYEPTAYTLMGWTLVPAETALCQADWRSVAEG